jgi:hypothetical protein
LSSSIMPPILISSYRHLPSFFSSHGASVSRDSLVASLHRGWRSRRCIEVGVAYIMCAKDAATFIVLMVAIDRRQPLHGLRHRTIDGKLFGSPPPVSNLACLGNPLPPVFLWL